MKKTIFIILLLILASPNFVLSQEATSTATTTEDVEENDQSATSTEETATSTDEQNGDDEDEEIEEVELFIKNGSQVIFSGSLEISDDEIQITDTDSVEHDIKKNNVLGILAEADSKSDDFEITDIDYNSGYDSFIVECLKFDSESFCDNWRYVVNDDYPNVGPDAKKIKEGDVVYFYFGQPRKLVLPNEAVQDEEFVIKGEEYNYQDNTWGKLSDYTVGIFLDDPEDPWSQDIISTSELIDGEASFTIEESGNYKVGIEEEYYYPFYEIEILATSSTSTATSTDDSDDDSDDSNDESSDNESNNGGSSNNPGGSGGSSDNNSDNLFNTDKAVDFLLSVQDEDGGFNADLYTDWAAIGLASVNEINNSLKDNVKNSAVSSDLYDKLRRAMALMALDLDPQEDYTENLLEEILAEFDGQQFGDQDFFNDDIFALIVLQNFGFDENDEEVSRTIDFIIGKQSGSGSWEGIDLTAAAIQALIEFDDYGEVSSALSRAESFLENRQNPNGGWSNAYSTAWAMMAMSALGYNFDDWQGNPLEYLGGLQNEDGGLLKDDTENNRIWSTSYAIASASDKTWAEILNDFSVENQSSDDDSDESNNDSSSSSGSSSSDLATNNTSSDNNDSEISKRFVENLDEILAFLDQQELASNQDEIVVDVEESDVEDNIENDNEIDIIQTNEEIRDQVSNNQDDNQEEQEVDDTSQVAAVSNALDFSWWVYLLSAIVALSISVIMFRIK
ncbi:MAG: DUF4430 domain-containing protein [Bacteriovoracia bacterium]